MKTAKTRHAHVVTYRRPSTRALQASSYEKRGETLTVYPSVDGWFEVRKVDETGRRHAEFIQQKEVRYTFKYLTSAVLKRLKLKRKK